MEADPLLSAQGRTAQVLNQLDAARQRSDSKRRSVILLIGSLVAFVILGAWFWSLKLVLQLIPILIIHELGHYFAMRYFRYRNVKMFFVPLLGAAVSGQSFNVPGWKKVIVSLAGPLPGIFLAIPMAAVAIAWNSDFWREATLMVLLINAFNLLPLLPLDGGWIAHALYFNRQPWLEAVFRVAAAGVMIFAGITWQLFFFTGFGALMLIAAPAAIRNSRIAAKIRRRGFSTLSEDDRTIPQPVVEEILGHLPKSGPAAEPKPLATQVQQVFETLNTRPPGKLATVLLTLLYLSGWVVSILVLAALFLWPQFSRAWSDVPVIAVTPGSISVLRQNQQPTRDNVNRYFVLGLFEDMTAVRLYAKELAAVEDCQFALATAGNTLMLSIDTSEASLAPATAMIEAFKQAADSHHWFESDDAFYFKLGGVFADPQTAQQTVARVDEMFLFGNDLNLIEPWSTQYSISDLQCARRTTRRTLDAPFDVAGDEELAALGRSASEDEEEDLDLVRKRFAEYDELYERKVEAAVAQMMADETGQHDPAVLSHWQRRPGGPAFVADDPSKTIDQNEAAWRSKLADLLGRIPGTQPVGVVAAASAPREPPVPVAEPQADLHALRFSATNGMVTQEDHHVRFYYIHFRNPIIGLPALMDWLEAKGCEQLEFQIVDGDILDDLP